MYIKEKDIETAFVAMLHRLVNDFQNIKDVLKDNIATSIDCVQTEKLDEIIQEIENEQQAMLELIRAKRHGQINETEYNKRGNEIETKINELIAQKETFEKEEHGARIKKKRLDDIMELIDKIDVVNKFDEELFKNLVDTIIVRKNTLEFQLKVGISESVEIPR